MKNLRNFFALVLLAASAVVQVAYADGGWGTTTPPSNSGWNATTELTYPAGRTLYKGRLVRVQWISFNLDGLKQPVCPDGTHFNPEGWEAVGKGGAAIKQPKVCFAFVLNNK